MVELSAEGGGGGCSVSSESHPQVEGKQRGESEVMVLNTALSSPQASSLLGGKVVLGWFTSEDFCGGWGK